MKIKSGIIRLSMKLLIATAFLTLSAPALSEIVTITGIEILPGPAGVYASAIFPNVGLQPVGVFHLVGFSDIRPVTDFYGAGSPLGVPLGIGQSLKFNFGFSADSINVDGSRNNSVAFYNYYASGAVPGNSASTAAFECYLFGCKPYTGFTTQDIAQVSFAFMFARLLSGPRRVPVLTSLDGTQSFLIGQYTVPEPATWALMLVGFSVTGLAIRRRRTSVVAA